MHDQLAKSDSTPTIGIIMHIDSIWRIPGDIGNVSTFPFPVKYKFVNISPEILMNPERALNETRKIVSAAKELECEGVRAITGGCGFMAIYQSAVSSSVDVPVFLSSLLQVQLLYSMLGATKKIGIITANSRALTEEYLKPAARCVSFTRVVVAGLENSGFCLHCDKQDVYKRYRENEKIVVDLALSLVKKNPDIKAIVLECTNLPPYAAAIRRSLDLPVFDIVSLTHFVYRALNPFRFGWSRCVRGGV